MSDDRMGEMHIIHQNEHVDPDDHDAVILQCASLTEALARKLIQACGYNPVDVVCGALWGLAAVALSIGISKKKWVETVLDCYDRRREQEAIDAKAGTPS